MGLFNQNQVAALYVDLKRGPYTNIPDVDCWDEERDARMFPGGCPVVAHPPCASWGVLKHLSNENSQSQKHLGVIAVHQVMANGGVLEHPRYSSLWDYCSLPKPNKSLPVHVGNLWALEIDQCRFGHQAIKHTWLLFCGVHPEDLPPIPPEREPTHSLTGQIVGGSLPKMKTLERHVTPPYFAEWLVAAARSVVGRHGVSPVRLNKADVAAMKSCIDKFVEA